MNTSTTILLLKFDESNSLLKIIEDWKELNIGIQRGWLTITTAIKIAKRIADKTNTFNEKEMQIYMLDDAHHDCLVKVVNALSEESKLMNSEVFQKWQYIILQHIYKKAQNIENLFDNIMYIYAEFDYPESMSSFIPYMPQENNDQSIDINETPHDRMLNRFRSYLIEKKKFYKVNLIN